MKLNIFVPIAAVLLLNIIGIVEVDFLFYGIFVLIAIYSSIVVKKIGLSQLLLNVGILAVISKSFRIVIDFVFNYSTVTDEGKIVSVKVIVISGVIDFIIALIIAVLVWFVGLLLNKRDSIK